MEWQSAQLQLLIKGKREREGKIDSEETCGKEVRKERVIERMQEGGKRRHQGIESREGKVKLQGEGGKKKEEE